MISLILLIAISVFVAFDALHGLRRGLVHAAIRFGIVLACAAVAFFTAGSLSDMIMAVSVTVDGEAMTLSAFFEGLIVSGEEVASLLEGIPTLKGLILAAPVILIKEIVFLLSFLVLRFLSWPVSAILSRLVFPKKKKVDGVKVKRRCFRGLGLLVGAVQGVLCFAVVMVPVFGFLQLGEVFVSEFGDDEGELGQISATIDESFVAPLNKSPVADLLNKTGVRKACMGVFRSLSKTNIVVGETEKEVAYFETLEGMFPTVSSLVAMKDADFENMTDDDYENLANVIQNAQSSETVSAVVKESISVVTNTVVEEGYKGTADIILSTFVEKLMEESLQTDTSSSDTAVAETLKVEVEGLKEMMAVLNDAAEDGDSSEEITVDDMMSNIVESTAMYETVLEIGNDTASCETIQSDIELTEDAKQEVVKAVDKYRKEQSLELGESSDEFKRLEESAQSIAKILGITLTELENIILDASDGQTDLEDVLDEYENQGGSLDDLEKYS